MSLTAEKYTEKTMVIRGDYDKYADLIVKELSGRYNTKLRGGPGWLISMEKSDRVKRFISKYGEKKREETPPVSEDEDEEEYIPAPRRILKSRKEYIPKKKEEDRIEKYRLSSSKKPEPEPEPEPVKKRVQPPVFKNDRMLQELRILHRKLLEITLRVDNLERQQDRKTQSDDEDDYSEYSSSDES
jgi:hypothetical protein